jgi:hypothetical protein
MKTLKFRPYLIPLILSGEKTSTWRLFDDKDLQVGDMVDLINWDTKEVFGKAELTEVREKPLGQLEDADFEGQEKFESEEKMYEEFKKYYGDKVDENTIVKIIKFKLV